MGERDRVLKALSPLNHRQRAVVVLRFYEDLTEPAIAEQLDIPLGTVKSSLSRALPILRQQLETTMHDNFETVLRAELAAAAATVVVPSSPSER